LLSPIKKKKNLDTYVRYLPIVEGDDEPPSRRVVLAWRRSFTRYEAIAALRNAIVASELPGVHRLT
jgi:LysR family hydrogen peroxide-inducible transcriptional activator